MSADQRTGQSQISDLVPFLEVAQVLEKTCKFKTNPEKNKYISNFITHCRNNFVRLHHTLNSEAAEGDSIYPIIRILLPSLDRDRAAYGIKASTLGRLLAETLGVNDKDKLKLTKFRDPGKSGNEAENFALLVYTIMQSRFSDATPSRLTLTALHDVLDRLSRGVGSGVNQNVQKQIFLELFTKWKITPLEGKWICRILLKNLEFGVSSHMIFKFIHPQAKELYGSISNLKKLCQTLNDPKVAVDAGKISLNYYIKPMLCKRTTTLDDFDTDSIYNNAHQEQASTSADSTGVNFRSIANSNLMAPPFVVETKWDGERFQIHYDGKVLKYMSKKGFDFSDNFNMTLSPRFKTQIQPEVRSFIIDGEMMAWNKKYKVFTQKGDQIDVKRFNVANPNHCPAFVAFDVLYHNDKILIDKPLQERSKLLRSILKEKEGAVLVPPQQIVHTRQQVEAALNTAIDNLQEGLIIKSIDSKYEPGKRGLFWRKLKPEFIYGSTVCDLDLLIVGANFTESTRKAGTISHFMVAVINKTSTLEEFYPLAYVGAGMLRNTDMQALVAELTPCFERKKYSSVHFSTKKPPDLYINPMKSIVVSVKASEITPSDQYVINFTLRFPRITRIRRDKKYNQVMTLEEFKTLNSSCQGKLAKRTDGKGFGARKWQQKRPQRSSDVDSSDEEKATTPNKKEKTSDNKVAAIRGLDNRLETDTTTASTSTEIVPKQTSQLKIKQGNKCLKREIFKNKVFCLYGSAAWKTKMQKDIITHGGTIVQNPVKDKFYLVGESESNMKVENAIKTFKYDILRPEWIQRCIFQEELCLLSPRDFYQYTDETGKLFKDKFDKFGDSYTDPLSLADAKTLVEKVTLRTQVLDDDSDSGSDMDVAEEVEAELFPREARSILEKYNFFSGLKVAFRGAADPVLEAMIEFYGGKIAFNEFEAGVSHIIVQNRHSSRTLQEPLSALLVKPKWVRDCVNEKTCLDEFAYSAD